MGKSHRGQDRNAGRPAFFSCTRHGKLAYGHRADAKAAARRLHDRGVREYPCTAYRNCWHIGHIPPAVRRGELTAAEWYDLPRRERARRWALETAEGPGSCEPSPSS